MDDAAAHEDQDAALDEAPLAEDIAEVVEAPDVEPDEPEEIADVEPDEPEELADEEPEPEEIADVEPEPLSLEELVADLSDEDGSESIEAGAEATEPEAEIAGGPEEASLVGGASVQAEPVVLEPKPVRSRLWTRIPFWLLGLAWAGFVGSLTYLLWPVSSGVFVTSPLYSVLVFGGAGLVVIGFVTGLVVWVVAHFRAEHDGRAGLFRTVWMRALGWTSVGVALWWIALVAMDLHRTGVIR